MDYRTYHLAELLPEALERITGRRTPEAALTREEPVRPPMPPRLSNAASRPRHHAEEDHNADEEC